jgi:Flp pilus assembly pilin Flp
MQKILKNQKGQGIMEYVVISSLIGICCLVAVKNFGEVVQNRIENMKSFVSEKVTLQDLRNKQ